MSTGLSAHPAVVTAFDAFADEYDATFTNSPIGRAQRNQVWSAIEGIFRAGDHVLELNCGTGEDARHLAMNGVTVTACDSSLRMVRVARGRNRSMRNVRVHHLATESVLALRAVAPFDGAFSNFSGLNCVEDVGQAAADVSRLLKSGSSLVIVVSSRWCLWELVWYGCALQWRKAVRRWRGSTKAKLAGSEVGVWYCSASELRRIFSPCFRLHSRRAIGLFVPPSYADALVRRRPRLLRTLEAFDRFFCRIPLLADFGDHMLLHFVRTEALAEQAMESGR